jgi:uncharacterized membrane protein YtjA (UPF0391 family)
LKLETETETASGNPAQRMVLQSRMLTWAIIFGICALIFGLLGFTGRARGFATIARFPLAVFLILLVLALIFGGYGCQTTFR